MLLLLSALKEARDFTVDKNCRWQAFRVACTWQSRPPPAMSQCAPLPWGLLPLENRTDGWPASQSKVAPSIWLWWQYMYFQIPLFADVLTVWEETHRSICVSAFSSFLMAYSCSSGDRVRNDRIYSTSFTNIHRDPALSRLRAAWRSTAGNVGLDPRFVLMSRVATGLGFSSTTVMPLSTLWTCDGG